MLPCLRTCPVAMQPGLSSASASGTWHSRLVYSGVASRPARGISSCSLRLVGSAGDAAGVALADRAYSFVMMTHTGKTDRHQVTMAGACQCAGKLRYRSNCNIAEG